MVPTPSTSDFAVTEAMLVYGGSFVRALGRAARCADPVNLTRIKVAFPDLWTEYADIAKDRAAAEARRVR